MQSPHNTLFELPPVSNDVVVVSVVKKKKHRTNTYMLQGSLYRAELNEIVQLACNYYGVQPEEVCERNLHPKDEIAKARRLICYLWGATKGEHFIQYIDIMILFHLQNHTSIIKGMAKAFEAIKRDAGLKHDVKIFEIYLRLKSRQPIKYPLPINNVSYKSRLYGKETIYPATTCKDKMELAKLIQNKVPIDVKQLIINNHLTITL